MNPGMSLRVFPHSEVISQQILLACFTWEKHTSTHDTFAFVCIFLNDTKSDNSNYKAITVGVSGKCEKDFT